MSFERDVYLRNVSSLLSFCFDFFSRYGIWALELCCCWLPKQRKEGGRTSDVHVTRESAFYDILEQHDEVMADRGFTIAEDLLLQHAKLHIPPGKRGKEQFSKSEVKKTKEIANLRIYVEQAIRRLKTFRLIKNELPISMLGNLDNIITVCAAICNLYKPLCKP